MRLISSTPLISGGRQGTERMDRVWNEDPLPSLAKVFLRRLPATGIVATLPRMMRFRILLIPLLLPSAGLFIGCAHEKKHVRSDDATLTQADLPSNVEKAFQRDHALATVKQIDKQINDGNVRYIITYYDPDGTRHQTAYDREGDVLDAQSNTPREESR